MKRTSSWRPPEPSLYRKTPPEILALEDRLHQAARRYERRRQAFQSTVNGVLLTSAATTVLALAAVATAWWR
jgi:hypothetical protein